MYERITRGIKVVVRPQFLESQSKPDEGHFVWSYTIVVENHGPETVTLRTRYWKITDATGKVQELRGAGVVGEQPVLKPGDTFQYTSGCPLKTPSGFMVGCYQMQGEGGNMFNVDIPAFSLDCPHDKHAIN
ncbi:Co2+/Mg2+ efflux protein ApaG [Aestuariivirga sp.]|uniref:Co2+/Mg2+ efflux protein ApaG n=1 Tax=Aestuariivirga sp. TaxID=2650926 RepID=UPI0039E66B0F